MATIGNTVPTLLDLTKRMGPDGTILETIEAQSKVNPILDDISFIEGNLVTGHRFISRAALPAITWRRYNQGLAPVKSAVDAYEETCGSMEGLVKIDTELAKLGGNEAAYLADEERALVQSFGIELATALFYYSTLTAPEKIMGLTPRLNATASNPASAQIIKADGSASGNDQTSIWLVGWGPRTVTGIIPKGLPGGLVRQPLGIQLAKDAASNEFPAHVTRWSQKVGLAVMDSRYLVRGCNIDTSTWTADLSTGADLVQLMYDMRAALWETNTVMPVFYMNRKTFSMLNKQLAKKGTVNLLEYVERNGKRVDSFLGIPIRVVDAITITESVVS